MQSNNFRLKQVVDKLSASYSEGQNSDASRELTPPSSTTIIEILETIKSVLFPGFFGEDCPIHTPDYFIGLNIDVLHSRLATQIARALQYGSQSPEEHPSDKAETITIAFLVSLPEIKRLLETDIQAICDNDPAVETYGEVVACYPVVKAMIHYRVAHELLRLGVPLMPRIITELAHSTTGIDIHPGATIGEYFAIDHGTGVVIGETCVIGNHVTLYQGVTLGAKNFTLDAVGHPMNIARHPIIQDNVTIYSNATILGRITIGHHSVIGGNVWLTQDVPPHSRILQSRVQASTFTDGLGI